MLIFVRMRFGIKDICIVSLIGVLTGCYIVKIGRGTLDSFPINQYLVAAAGAIAALLIILMIRPLIKQESSD
jgi:hypothetical protein